MRQARGSRWVGVASLAALLVGCGGGDGGGGASSGPVATAPTPSPAPTPTPTTTAGCSLAERQEWARAQIDTNYLFPDLVAASVEASARGSLQDYVDALVAPARAQNRDRYFTYVTSIAEENAYYNSGSTAGFGIRLGYDTANSLVGVLEAYEGGPALAAGIDRGTLIQAVGTSEANLVPVSTLLARGGPEAVSDALGPSTPGLARTLRISTDFGASSRVVTVSKSDFALQPVSSRYGYKIIEDGGRRVGYVNLRTFISTADDQLRTAFASFRAAGITSVIVDLRYNGGGLLSTAELFTDLLGGARTTSDVQSYVTFRPSLSSQNETQFFAPRPQSIAPTRVAFIGTGSTASASEYVINAMVPYLRTNAALIGSNTYGKPVGQIAIDRAACDDRLRVVALALQNADRRGADDKGLATTVEASCRADDDVSYPLGDGREALTRAALDYLAGRSCTRIGGAPPQASTSRGASLSRGVELLVPDRPDTVQRESPGTF